LAIEQSCIVKISGPDSLRSLQRIAEEYRKLSGRADASVPKTDDDDDVPELVEGESFEKAAES
jgi:nascent polypeptide-associated complex subunit beta